MGKKFDPAALLKKQGWSEGEGLGKDHQGMRSYVKVSMKAGNYGIGADRSVFVEEERAQFSSILDTTLANVRKENKRRKKMEKAGLTKEEIDEKHLKKKQKESEKEAAKEQPSSSTAGFVASGKVVNGVLQKAEKTKEKRAAESDSESSCSDSSSDAGPCRPIEQMSDAELFAACGGARMGKRGACHNNKKIERIRQHEADVGAKLVAKARARWQLQRGSRSPHRSPVSAPLRSPALPKRSTPVLKAKKSPAKAASPIKKVKKEKKEKKKKSEKKEKKAKKDKRLKTE